MSTSVTKFWDELEERTDRASYRPVRNERVVVQLETAVPPTNIKHLQNLSPPPD